jgi:hypothetical protein
MGFNPFSAIGDAARAVGHVAEDGGKALADGGKAFEGALSDAAKAAKNMSVSDLGHTALDVVGMVPVVGSVANLANAGWYAAQGNWAAAAESAAAAIPVAGDGVDAARLGDDAVKLGGDAVQAEKVATAATGGARVLDHAAEAGAKVVKAGKAMLPVAAAVPGAINAAAHGDWRAAALSAASMIPFGHLADGLPGVARLSEHAASDDEEIRNAVDAPRAGHAAHRQNLGTDPAIKGFRENEAETALRVERKLNIRLERYQPPSPEMKGDWVDSKTGEVYDGCSPPDTTHFDRQMSNGNYQKSLLSHVNNSNVDYVVIDTTGLSLPPAQVADLNSVISRLTAEQQAKIVRIT